MKFKKVLSVFLVIAMLISVASVSVMADSGYVANYDKDTPIIIVHDDGRKRRTDPAGYYHADRQ